jgi:hypothetical protein
MIRHTDNIADLAAALVAASAELSGVSKGREASIPTKSGGSYAYRYAALEDVLDTVRPVLAKHGLTITQTASNQNSDFLTISTSILHYSGQYIVFEPLALPNGRTAQEIGSAITYGRRYHLLACLGLAASDDDDGAAAAPRIAIARNLDEGRETYATERPSGYGPRPASGKQISYLIDLVAKHRLDCEVPGNLTAGEAKEAIDHILKTKTVPPGFGIDVADDYPDEEPF